MMTKMIFFVIVGLFALPAAADKYASGKSGLGLYLADWSIGA